MMYEEENKEMPPQQYELAKPQRLHPTAIFFNLIKVIKETILGLGVGLIFTLKESVIYFLIFVSIFLVLLLINSILSWLRYTYRVEDNELRIEQGIFIRKKRYISINRIHKIDVTADVFHRLFKLVKVQIDTASSGGGAEVELSAIKLGKAAKLRRALQKGKRSNESTEEMVQNPIKNVTWRNLFIAGSTSGTAGFLLVAMLALFTQIEELIPQAVYKSAYSFVIQSGIIFIVTSIILLLFLLWLIGIAGTMIKYGKFTIEKRATQLFIKRGLIETKELTIPFDRIQAISVKQSLIRKPLKYVKLTAVVAGGSFDKQEAFPVIFPLMKEADVQTFLAEFLPEYEHISPKKNPLAKRGIKYYLLSSIFPLAVVAVPAYIFLPSYLWVVVVFMAICLWNGFIRHRDSGYHLDERTVTLQIRRVFEQETVMMYHRRIQAMEKKQHRLQQWERIATMRLSLIGSAGLGTHYALKHLQEADIDQIGDWYSREKQTVILSNISDEQTDQKFEGQVGK